MNSNKNIEDTIKEIEESLKNHERTSDAYEVTKSSSKHNFGRMIYMFFLAFLGILVLVFGLSMMSMSQVRVIGDTSGR